VSGPLILIAYQNDILKISINGLLEEVK